MKIVQAVLNVRCVTSIAETKATKHVKEKHAHRCNECLKEFKFKQQLSNHVSTTHKPKRAANHPPAVKTVPIVKKNS